jgi:outer membrane protein TolC
MNIRLGKIRYALLLWMGIALVTALLFLLAAPADAQTQLLKLEEALAIVAEKNRDIEKAREYIAWAQGKYVEERSAALPQLTASAFLGWDQDESQKVYGPSQTERKGRQSALIGVTQPIFTWGQVSAAIRAAKAGLLSAEEQLRVYQQAAQRDVSTTFYNVLFARELNTLALQNLEQKKRHLEESRRKLQAGVATDYDVLAAEVAVENARPEVIRTENLILNTRERLRFLLAVERGEVDAIGSLSTDITPHPSYEEAFALAREKRPDLADIRHRIGVNRELVVLANAQDKPRVDFKGQYGWNYLEQQTVSADGPSWSVGVQISYPFFDGFRTKGKAAQADSDLRRIQIDEAKQVDAVSLEARDAVNAIQESKEIVLALAGNVSQAERLLAMAEKGYELGVKTRLEVDDAELNHLQAKGSLSRARRDYLVARVNLQWVMGVLGEGRN